ncbi:predicted protein [Arabidopsis lyrata subsp. lyrata]|uniref:Predicted protein n=1 Tax=Arabidopsis lyrata subsp. lyrata TaxID=81972 RepID=D7M4V4_ARALL|nr:predicted protein [Arabidopsis lyrata subsp. lyrata]
MGSLGISDPMEIGLRRLDSKGFMVDGEDGVAVLATVSLCGASFVSGQVFQFGAPEVIWLRFVWVLHLRVVVRHSGFRILVVSFVSFLVSSMAGGSNLKL